MRSQLIRGILRTKPSSSSVRLAQSIPCALTRTITSPSPTLNNNTRQRGIATKTLPLNAKAKAGGPTAGQSLTDLASASPHVEVLRYEHKNVKWTLRHVEFFSDCLAVGLLENGLQPGDAVLSWLPSHFSEQHILQFACSKAGLVLYNLDPTLAQSNPAKAKEALQSALELSEATCLFSQDVGSDVNYTNLVKEVIPDIRIFNFADGMPFFSPKFPNLRFPIHTGFDQVENPGMLLLKHMLVPSGELTNLLADSSPLDGSTPLLGEFVLDKDGVPTSKGIVHSNETVLKEGVWPEMVSVLSKDYKEIEGVGVVF